MGIDPKIAKQWLDNKVISQEDYDLIVGKKSKFGAVKTDLDGITFHSGKEAKRYAELKMLEKAGEITNLKLQPKFPLVVNTVKICDYFADFQYMNSVGILIVEDCKGYKTPEYRLKNKLVLAVYGIRILET